MDELEPVDRIIAVSKSILNRQGDSADLAERIRWLLEHPEDANAMMNRGRERALERFTIQATAEHVLGLYEEIQNGKKEN